MIDISVTHIFKLSKKRFSPVARSKTDALIRDCAIIIRRGGPKTRGGGPSVKIMERRGGSTLDFSRKLGGGVLIKFHKLDNE